MEVDRSPLITSMEKRLGRKLTSAELRLILLAEEIIEKESQPSDTDTKAAGAE